MNRTRGKKGFTIAELMIVVAIILILAAVSFVAVPKFQRSSKLLEMDGLAKEIFIAAQNHLTLADSQGLLAGKEFGTKEGDTDVYFFVVPPTSLLNGDNVLRLMLPEASVDDSIRLGGNYIIRYQASTATVLDVFYTEKSGVFPAGMTSSDFASLLSAYADTASESRKEARKSYGEDKTVIGWYGGTAAREAAADKELHISDFEIVNGDRLYATIPNPNKGDVDASLRLTVRGKDSGAKKEYVLILGNGDGNDITYSDLAGVSWDAGYSECTVVLDDVRTSGRHFADLFSGFYPGEDLELTLDVYSKTKIVKLPESIGPKTVNSLFADVEGGTAEISSFRHLENLDEAISSLSSSLVTPVAGAVQTMDLSWTDFLGGSGNVYTSANAPCGNGLYFPVVLPAQFSYDGGVYDGSGKLTGAHSLTGVKIDYTGNAGLFGEISGGSISNLQLVDFTVTATNGSAGALVGEVKTAASDPSSASITNVIAYCSSSAKYDSAEAAFVKATAGDAGGLIGGMTGASVKACAAAMPVSTASGSAGGLIGGTAGGNVIDSYSGGRTTDGAYSKTYNVTGTTNVGGLIGSAAGTGISACYSTCSASGATVGGLVGTASGSIANSYATGLVGGGASAKGAFAGSLTGGSSQPVSGKYYMIINESYDETEKSYKYAPAVGSAPNVSLSNIAALDAGASAYNEFVGTRSSWTTAGAYDSTLNGYYSGKYPLQSVTRLDGTADTGWLVATHRGDWPAPELFVINEAS